MAVQWRKREGLNPEPILARLRVSRGEYEGKVSFNAFQKIECDLALESMLKFPFKLSAADRSQIVSRAVHAAGLTDLSSKAFLEAVNVELNDRIRRPQRAYELVTSFSFAAPFLLSELNVGGCTIEFDGINLRSTHREHREALIAKHNIKDATHSGYCFAVIRTRAKSEHEAVERSLTALNLVRAYLSFWLNGAMVVSFGSSRQTPINKVLNGKYHTLHFADGRISSEGYWYNQATPIVSSKEIADQDEIKDLEIGLRWFAEKISSHPFSEELVEALDRYVVAFDGIDYNASIIGAWGALEALAANPNEPNNERVPYRCAFLCEDFEFEKQILEHIREYRNGNVHRGEYTTEPKLICYQLQRHFRNLTYFLLRNGEKFSSKTKALEFLDLPPRIEDLRRRIDLLEYASQFLKAEPQSE